MLGLAYLMPDCSLEVSLHPEGPVTGQLDQGFPSFSLVPEQMWKWWLSCHNFLILLLYFNNRSRPGISLLNSDRVILLVDIL
jgi:hypothetical protein